MRDASTTKSFQVWDVPDAVSDILNVYIVTGAFWKKLGLGAWRNNFGIPVQIVLHFGLSFSTQVHAQLFYSSKSLAYGVQNLIKGLTAKDCRQGIFTTLEKSSRRTRCKIGKNRWKNMDKLVWVLSLSIWRRNIFSGFFTGSELLQSWNLRKIWPQRPKDPPIWCWYHSKKPWSHKVDSYEVRLSKHFESAIERMNRELPPEHRHAGMRACDGDSSFPDITNSCTLKCMHFSLLIVFQTY